MKPSILPEVPVFALTGGTGFVGGALLSALCDSGYRVQALTRAPQQPRNNVVWVEGDLDNPEALAQCLESSDIIIHAAGAIKARSRADFFKTNVQGTEHVLRAATRSGVRRFMHISSLAAQKPQLSDYCDSKAQAESYVRSSSLEWTIIRPPAVYGPGDRATLALFRQAQSRLMPITKGKVPWIYIDDLVRGVIAALTPSMVGCMIEVDDGMGAYTHAEFAKAVRTAVGGHALLFPVPRLGLYALGWANAVLSRLVRATPMLTPGKAREIANTDWSVECLPAFKKLWHPHVSLAPGLSQTAAWYKDQSWL